MRRLLGGAAFAALLAAGLPAAAQTAGGAPPAASDQTAPATPHKPAMSSRQRSGTSTPAATSGETTAKGKKHAARHKTMAKRHTSPADNMAEQLNREELEKVQRNSAPMPGSGTSERANPSGAGAAPSNGTPFPDAGANSMPGTVTSGAHGKEQPQQ